MRSNTFFLHVVSFARRSGSAGAPGHAAVGQKIGTRSAHLQKRVANLSSFDLCEF